MQLETFFPYRLAVVAESFSRALIEVYGHEFGLSREEWRLLYLLAEEPEVDSLELARRTTLDKVQVSRAAQRLEDKQCITRDVADHDRRLRVYRCTAAGRKLFKQVRAKVDKRTRSILGEMSSADRKALDRGLDALLDAVAQFQDQAEGNSLQMK